MKLSDFDVDESRPDDQLIANPRLLGHSGQRRVVVEVSREALMDYFQVPGDVRVLLRQWNTVLTVNRAVLQRIAEAKPEAAWEACNGFIRLFITLEDLQRSGEKLSADVLNLNAGFKAAT